MDVSRGERVAIARTESVFREVNERIAEGAEQFNVREAQFVCECGDPSCTAGITTTLDEYERVRADGATFLLAPGHDISGVETVLERQNGRAVVEKRGGVVEEVARRLDPRNGARDADVLEADHAGVVEARPADPLDESR